MKFKNIFLAVAIPYIVSGCSALNVGESEYACSDVDEGLPCASVQDVYQLTNNDDYKEKIKDYSVNGKASLDVPKKDNMSKDVSFIPKVVPKPAYMTVPVRTPAEIMRIYIAPWESKAGDLNVPGFIYTEIEPRRWQLGERVDDVNESTHSVQKKQVEQEKSRKRTSR